MSSSSAAPSAPAVKKLLDSVSSGTTPTGPGIASYLTSLPVTNIHAGGAGIGSYLSSVPINSARMGGAGIASYLDSINAACEANRKCMLITFQAVVCIAANSTHTVHQPIRTYREVCRSYH
jgi:hypothetical protein